MADQLGPHTVVAIVPPVPKKLSNAPPVQLASVNKGDVKTTENAGAKPNLQAPANTVVVVSTPPELRKPSKGDQRVDQKDAPIEGLQHHFMTRRSLIPATSPEVLSAERAFEEKYVDVVDTDNDYNKQEKEHSQSYTNLTSHVKRIYLVFTIVMMLDATFSALAMYTFDQVDKTYSHQALGRIFNNKNQVPCNIIVLMLAISAFPLVGIAIIAYQKPKVKFVLHGRWAFFVIFETYVISCLVVYSANTTKFPQAMEKGMLRDLHLSPDAEGINILRGLSQSYYGCCGVYGYKDWTPEKRNNKYDNNGYPIGCCNRDVEEKECFSPIKETVIKDGEEVTLIYTEGCLDHEMSWTYTITVVYLLIICIIVVVTMATTVYLYNVVRMANKYEVELVLLK